MNAPRLWPAVQALGRNLVCGKSDIFQQSIRIYNHQNVNIGSCNLNGNLRQNHLFDDRQTSTFSHSLFHTGRGSYMKVVSRNFSTGSYLFCREFSDGENEHAHDVLCSLPAYSATTVDTKAQYNTSVATLPFTEKNWPFIETEELIQSFIQISKQSFQHSLELEDSQYYQLCFSLSQRIAFLNDNQLMQVLSALSCWPPTQSKNSSNFLMLWNALDESCSKRISYWDISKIFLVADHWYALRLSRISIYFTRLLNALGLQILQMTPTQLVQFMFYANLNREFGIFKKDHLELKIKESLKSISIEELGIIAMGLFKTQTYLQNTDLIDDIIKKTVSNIETVSDHSLGSILKLLNKSLPSSAYSQCYQFLENLNLHLEKFNNLVLLQAALLGNNLLVFHREVMNKVAERFGREITQLRLKDIERFTYALMLYKFVPPAFPDIHYLIIQELRKPERIVEINHFPKCFVSCVNYLVTIGIFPPDLISAALQPSMVQLLKSSNMGDMGRECSELNWSLKIEGPTCYPGYQLDLQLSHHLTKRFMGRIPFDDTNGLTHQERLLLDIQKKLTSMMGRDGCVAATFILPHFFNPDLVFCTNHEGEPVELPLEFCSLPFAALKHPYGMHLGLMWNVVIIGGRNSFIRDTTELRGNLEMKKRQLTKLGYRVIVVPYSKYVKTSIKYKLACLERCLKDVSSLNMEGRIQLALDSLKTVKHETSLVEVDCKKVTETFPDAAIIQ